MQKTETILRDGIAAGLHLGAQLYVSLKGSVVADLAVGEARAGVPLTRDSLMLWYSTGKPVTAVAIAQLWEEGKLSLDDPVARHIPAFAQNGKERVTIRHVLTHTGCFPNVNVGWPRNSWEQIIGAICAAPLQAGWTPGRSAAYHAYSGWFILGEVVRVLDGRPLSQYFRDEIFVPLGMNDSWIGMPAERFGAYGDRISVMHNSDKSPPRPDPLHRAERFTGCAPGGNATGPLREAGIFYEMLLRGGERDGARILSAQSVEALTARHRAGMFDQIFKHVIDWGLGFIVDSKLYGESVPYNFGPHASPRTFGHGGSMSSIAFADPEHGLVVAWACNGQPGDERHHARARAINASIYEELRLRS